MDFLLTLLLIGCAVAFFVARKGGRFGLAGGRGPDEFEVDGDPDGDGGDGGGDGGDSGGGCGGGCGGGGD